MFSNAGSLKVDTEPNTKSGEAVRGILTYL